MRILLIDSDSCGLDMAYRFAEAGHEVRWFMPKARDGKMPRDGDGFAGVQKVPEWKAHMMWAKSGLIVPLYNNKYMSDLDRYRSFGFPVFGPSEKSADLEIKRGEGMKLFKDIGIDVPEYKTFKTLADAERYAWKAQDRLVFKVMGDEEDKALSYVCCNPADMVARLQLWQARGMKLKGECMLQECIDMLAEIGVSGWMGKDGFLPGKWNINFEHKKMMPGNFGPNTGEMGTVCQYVEAEKLADDVLMPLEDSLRKMGHFGDIDVGCGIDKKGKAWPFEFTARLGWPSTQILMAAHSGDPAQWMKDALDGKDTLKVSQDVALGVIIAVPPFPEKDDPDRTVGLPIYGAEEVWSQVSPWQMMIEQGPDMEGDAIVEKRLLKTSGTYVAVVTGLAPKVRGAIDKAYAAVKKIEVANKIVRNDIGDQLKDELPELHKHGYALAMEH